MLRFSPTFFDLAGRTWQLDIGHPFARCGAWFLLAASWPARVLIQTSLDKILHTHEPLFQSLIPLLCLSSFLTFPSATVGLSLAFIYLTLLVIVIVCISPLASCIW